MVAGPLTKGLTRAGSRLVRFGDDALQAGRRAGGTARRGGEALWDFSKSHPEEILGGTAGLAAGSTLSVGAITGGEHITGALEDATENVADFGVDLAGSFGEGAARGVLGGDPAGLLVLGLGAWFLLDGDTP